MNVVILDTGCANLNSVKSAIARHGYEPKDKFPASATVAKNRIPK